MSKIETTSKVSLKLNSRINLGWRGARSSQCETYKPRRPTHATGTHTQPKQTTTTQRPHDTSTPRAHAPAPNPPREPQPNNHRPPHHRPTTPPPPQRPNSPHHTKRKTHLNHYLNHAPIHRNSETNWLALNPPRRQSGP